MNNRFFNQIKAQTAKNPAIYWANRLHETMAVSGTHDRSLIRIMVMRSEKDMQDIKVQFQSKYGKTLESFIKVEFLFILIQKLNLHLKKFFFFHQKV